MMKRMIMLDEDSYKEIVSALRRLRMAVDALPPSFMSGELDIQVERIEKALCEEENNA